MSEESYKEHRERDEKSIDNFLIFTYFFPSFRFLIPLILLLIVAAWVFNILGESTILNDKNIYYSGINPWTGQRETVQGCRPEHLTEDHMCDNSFNRGSYV